MNNIFTGRDIQAMSDEIDKQLRELQACFKSDIRTGKDQILESLPVSQIKVIESVTKEKTSDFMKKFSKKAKMDLCEEGGLLYQQWKKWGDLNNKDAIQSFGNILLGMGIGAGNVQILIVAIVVIVVHIGIRVICEDYPDNEVSQ